MAYVFQSIGFPKSVTDLIYDCRVWLPRRPNRCLHNGPGRDDFITDLENEILRLWNYSIYMPKGPKRFEKAAWAALVQNNVFPHHSDIDWDEYVDWVSNGGGDDMFVDDDSEIET